MNRGLPKVWVMNPAVEDGVRTVTFPDETLNKLVELLGASKLGWLVMF
jgi:hypothetical protein